MNQMAQGKANRLPQDASDPAVLMQGVNKWYGTYHALRDIDLNVARGERIVICGPSGSGKSTLIRCINQLETIQKGRIIVDGHDLTAGGKNVDIVRQETGMVFQQFNLFPHMTVLENCTLAPMKVRGVSKTEAEKTARKYLERVRPNTVDGDEAKRWQTLHPIIGKPRSATSNNSTNGAKCRVNRRRVFRLV